ncbi:GFA family protein [Thiosocius teredinicola]|uniref:GFA family protein n=1 Tax=Thiosocius teredinicola TaxID=1973002 RepID=UPI0009914110
MPKQNIEGGCQCGAVRYVIEGEPIMAAICHCSTCRKANAAPAVAWAMFESGQVAFVAGQLKKYEASEEAIRGFCAECGTQISFEAEYLPGLIDITVGSFDKPESIQPSMHYWYSRHLSWAEFSDELPRYPEFPPVEQ